MRLLHRNLKGTQIDLTRRTLINHGIGDEAVILLVIAGEMLETAGDALTLTAPDPSCRQRTGYQRVLRKIFKVSSTQGIPLDVGTGSQNHAYVLIPCLLGNCPAFFREQIFIKRARRQRSCRKADSRPATIDTLRIRIIRLIAQTMGPVRHPQRRNMILRIFLRHPVIGAAAK